MVEVTTYWHLVQKNSVVDIKFQHSTLFEVLMLTSPKMVPLHVATHWFLPYVYTMVHGAWRCMVHDVCDVWCVHGVCVCVMGGA